MFIDTNITTNLQLEFFVNNESAPYKTTTVNMLPNLGEIAEVTNISQASPANVSANDHGLSDGDKVFIYGVLGMQAANGEEFTVTVVDDNNFTIGVDTTGYDAYQNGGIITERKFLSNKVWKRIYAGGTGYQHRLNIESNGTSKPVRIHAFMPWFRARSHRAI